MTRSCPCAPGVHLPLGDLVPFARDKQRGSQALSSILSHRASVSLFLHSPASFLSWQAGKSWPCVCHVPT